MMNKPLFERYPKLLNAIPHLDLSNTPTPIEKLTFKDNIWVKRDDLTNKVYGGNKVRKLEFILAEVLAQGKKRVVTFGAIGTNHGVATSLFCKQLGLKCKVFLFDQPVTPTVVNNLNMMNALNAELHYKGSLLKTVAHYYGSSFANSRDYHLFAGGSNIPGCIGFVDAAFELKDQIQQELIPEPDFLYCPVGSSSTMAGLSLGCALAGMKTRVIGVRVAPSHLGIIPSCTPGTVDNLRRKTYQYLRNIDSSIPKIELPAIDLNDDYYGLGYGEASPKGNQASEVFRGAKLRLEPTYTAKTAAAALAHSDKSKNVVLYWHTYNSADTSQLSEKSDIGRLSTPLQQKIMAMSKSECT